MTKKATSLWIYGDSISTGTHGEGGYESLLKNSLGLLKIKNLAVGSSGLSSRTPDNGASILKKEENLPKDADLILVWHGSNDWYWGSPVGELTDKDTGTFLGAIGYFVARIREASPQGLLVWANPLFRYELPYEGTAPGSAYETKNAAGHTLLDYSQALNLAGAYHGFPVLDMHTLSGIHEWNQERFLEDMVHPNREGYKQIHRVLDDGIRHLMKLWGYEAAGKR